MRRTTIVISALFLLFTTAVPVSAEELVNRPFEDDTWTEGLVDLRSLDYSRTRLVGTGQAGGSLRVIIPTGGFRGLGPLDRLGPFDDASKAPNEVWYRYHVRLLSWNAASSGKLPGLAGLYGSSARGCIPPTETNRGWSARGMFDAPGTEGAPPGRIPIGTYLYHWAMEGPCGDGLWWNASLEQGRWHCVEGRVRLNSPSQADGVFQGWLDGKLAFQKGGIQYRGPGQGDVGVRHMWHNVYFGGQHSTPNPLSLQYDEVVVSTTGRVGCMRAFTDIGSTIHSRSISNLHALGYFYGCDYRLACPHRDLNRGEGAAFLSRILALPAATRDYFSDDTGSTYEGVINRLAEAGITKGCAPRQYCPERTMTRAEFATMLGRALGLRGDAANAFNDDNGHTLEQDINRFFAAGLTDGCGQGRFCPDRNIPRDEAAAFFDRSLGLLRPVTLASMGPPPDWPPPGDPPPIPPEEED